MMNIDYEKKVSPLSQTVERGGRSFQIQIYENGRGGWKLEIVDDEQNIMAWDDPFFTDEAALDEAMNSFDDDGDETIIDLDRFH